MSIEQSIVDDLSAAFAPHYLDVTNESGSHNVPPNSETHFKVVLVCEGFVGQRKVARHQRVYAALKGQLDGGVHALALHLYTPEEWAAREQAAPASPDCKGGSR